MKKNKIIVFSIVVIFFVFVVILYKLFPLQYTKEISTVAHEYDVDPKLIAAVVRVESSFRVEAHSSRNAIGLMQITPDTGRWIASKMKVDFREADLLDPLTNLRFGTWFLRYLMDRFNKMDDALKAYNAGIYAITSNRTLSAETVKYVHKVKEVYIIYKILYPFWEMHSVR